MIVVRVELWSAVTGKVTELARMVIANDGETTTRDPSLGSYDARTLRGRSAEALDRDMRSGGAQRRAKVRDWPRQAKHVWNLVSVLLARMGYGQ